MYNYYKNVSLFFDDIFPRFSRRFFSRFSRLFVDLNTSKNLPYLHFSNVFQHSRHLGKLGPYRPGRAVALAQQAANSATPEERETAAQECR